MQVPIACSGVQALPKTLHSHGLDHALQHLAALAGLRVGDADARDAVAQLGVEVRVGVGELQRALGDEAEPAPLEVRAQLEHLGQHASAPAGLPS